MPKSVEDVLRYIEEELASVESIMQMELDHDGVVSDDLKVERRLFNEIRDWIQQPVDSDAAKECDEDE